MLVQQAIHALCEPCEGLLAEHRPIRGEQVVVEEVHDHRSIAPSVCMDPLPPLRQHGMDIGEGIDGPMQTQPPFDTRAEAGEITALHGIAHEVAHDHLRIAAGEVKMTQEIHADREGNLPDPTATRLRRSCDRAGQGLVLQYLREATTMRKNSGTTTAMRARTMYWATQLLAWALLVTVIGLFMFKHEGLSTDQQKVLLLFYFTGIGISHWFRHVIIQNRWLERDLGHVLPRLCFVAVLLSLAAFLVMASAHDLFFTEYVPMLVPDPLAILLNTINWTLLLFIWSLGYFAYVYFVRSRREEILNLKLETASRENQLNTLRSQMNPHFMFNALNGIRGLVDEDPDKAKRAITQLSAILRNAMATVRRDVVPLGEEIDIVKAYLELEHMRYEERLRFTIDIPADLEREQVPPMLLQTLVENAVRHGIAPLVGGGDLHVAAERTPSGIRITVRNTGHYTPGKAKGSGIGLQNTKSRLAMLYGGQAHFEIVNVDGSVESRVDLPLRTDASSLATTRLSAITP